MNKKQLIVAWVIDRFRLIIGIPDIKKVKEAINGWVTYKPRLTKVYLFGSYVKRNKIIPKDIDIAVEISDSNWDTSHGLWCSEAKIMQEELCRLLDYNVHLEWFDETKHKIVKKGLSEGNIVIYEKEIK